MWKHRVMEFLTSFLDFKCYLTGTEYLSTAVLIFYFEVLHSFMWKVTVFLRKGQSKFNHRMTLGVFLKKI